MLVGDREVTRELTADENYAPYPEEVPTNNNYWWIYALIIAAIALSAIFFHFYQNGFSATGSQERISVPR
ncbi:hypothetical protein [Paraflavitalea speifideaquila]|uniref:hypothetical protein n=1 Tax=Paraflavitalea speifideaquila TaxID=3076558 RepID=UPI0028E3B9E9|nr:hypothetical protein [Paraflavitalea speifideiaquila]